MLAIGLLFVRILCDCFKPRPQLEAEILILRHQLNVAAPRARMSAKWGYAVGAHASTRRGSPSAGRPSDTLYASAPLRPPAPSAAPARPTHGPHTGRTGPRFFKV